MSEARRLYDKTGREIMPGDTLKIFHFRAAKRRQIYYMYKYVERYHESGKALIVSHLEPNHLTYLLTLDGTRRDDIEIVQGYAGVPAGQDFRERRPAGEVNNE